MATNARIGQVDHLLDDVQLAREDALARATAVLDKMYRARVFMRDAYEEQKALVEELAGPDEVREGGELFHKVADLRSHRAIRKAQPWDGKTDRRRKRHLEAVA